MAVLMFAMVCSVYICSICVKQLNTHTRARFLRVRIADCPELSIGLTKVPREHYPRPKTFSRAECFNNPVRFFAIVSMQRSGSGWFESLLNSHVNVSSNGEVFSVLDRRRNITTIVQTLDRIYNLDWLNSASKNQCSAAVGFKWMLNQGLMQHHEEIAEYFNRRGVSTIFLFRRNLLRRVVSVLANSYDRYAKMLNGTHKSHVHSLEEANALSKYKPVINSTSLISELEGMEATISKSLEYFGNTRHLILYYEDIINNRTKLKDVQEFLNLPPMSLKTGKFRIVFVPKSSSIAFVNAIEVFPTPPNFLMSESKTIISESDGRNEGAINLPFMITKTIYRINVGGPGIPPKGDKLWRKWEQDDDVYLLNPRSAMNSSRRTSRPNYKNETDDYFAPDLVYQTAKELNTDSSFNFVNITWSFPLRKKTLHLVRVHFYDIVAIASNGFLIFALYIGNNFSYRIDSPAFGNGAPYPIHHDFPVDSGENGSIHVSVGRLNSSESGQLTAFLNGIEIMEVMNEGSKDPFIREFFGDKKKKSGVGLLVGLSVGGFCLLCILGCGIWFGLKCRKRRSDEPSHTHTHTQWTPLSRFGGGSTQSRFHERTTSSSPIPDLNLGLKFSLAEIKTATNNFNKKFLVGEGGFGKVYKGVMKNGMKVAVKRSQPGAGQGISEFEREITILSRIRHRHLVSFIGYCDEGLEMILVYEFLEKGTLREHLYSSNLAPLPWKKRLDICIGAARGLHYLHKGSAGGIIHRDVKSTNILLDENLVAKVSDFGLSRAGPLDETHVSTDIKGTFGYLDPEYFRTQQLTEKSDVYSFGVLLLEILCARPALNPTLPREQINLAEWGLRCKKMDLLEEIIDPKLEGQIDPNSLRKYSDTIEKCLQDDATHRPTMADVLWDLEYALQLQQSTHPRMPHEDSETNVNDASSTVIRRFPSIGSSILRDDPDMSQDVDTHLTANEIFSQIRADHGR